MRASISFEFVCVIIHWEENQLGFVQFKGGKHFDKVLILVWIPSELRVLQLCDGARIHQHHIFVPCKPRLRQVLLIEGDQRVIQPCMWL